MNIEIRCGSESNPVGGIISVPGDKSISHRAVMLGSLASGSTIVRGFLMSEDCLCTIECMRRMGAVIEKTAEDELRIEGVGTKGLSEPDDVLYVGNSGTTLRLLTGVVSGFEIFCAFTGDESIRRRPMKRVIQPLSLMGARFMGRSGSNLAPFCVMGGGLSGIEYETAVASAQVKSAILLAGMRAKGLTAVTEPLLSRDHTERMLVQFGCELERSADGRTVRLQGGTTLRGVELTVPGDMSSAAFFLALAAIHPGSDLTVKNVGINPTRTGVLNALERMGCTIEVRTSRAGGGNGGVPAGEPVGDVRIVSGELKPLRIAAADVPSCIDELPVLAVVAARARGTSRIEGAGELRVKESDRISTLSAQLRKMGVEIRETGDGMIIEGPQEFTGAEVDSCGDHRLAMTLAVAATLSSKPTIVRNIDCVDTSFPGFFDVMAQICGKRGMSKFA